MSFTERLEMLINKKEITKNKMLTDLNLGKNSFVDWVNRNNTPNGETLSKIADYFNVSTDYLLGKTDIPNIPEELRGVKVAFYDGAFDGLDEKDVDLLKQMAKMLREQKNK